MATPPAAVRLGLNGDTARVVVAEFLATALLVVVGCGSIIGAGVDLSTDATAAATTPSQTLAAALGFGFAYMTMMHTFGHISAAHMNPATTLAYLVAKKIGFTQFVVYLIAQMLGSMTGAGILNAITGGDELRELGVTRVSETITSGEAFGVEFVITFIFVISLFSIIDPEHVRRGSLQVGNLHVGFAVAGLHLFAFKFTGCSFNPVRTFGPSVVANDFDNHWVYWIGPLSGGLLAGLVYELVFYDKLASNDNASTKQLTSQGSFSQRPLQFQPQQSQQGRRPIQQRPMPGVASWAPRTDEDTV